MATIFTFIQMAHRSIMSVFGITLALSSLGMFMKFQMDEKISTSSFLLNTEEYTSDMNILFWMALISFIAALFYDFGLLFGQKVILSIGLVTADLFAIIYTFIVTKWFLRLNKI